MALLRVSTNPTNPEVLVEALAMLAISVQRAYDTTPQAVALAAEATQVALAYGRDWDIGIARFWQGVIAADIGDSSAAKTFATASLAAFADAGDTWNSGPHSTLGDLALKPAMPICAGWSLAQASSDGINMVHALLSTNYTADDTT